MLGAFERLGKSVLRHLGQDALLLSGGITVPCRVNIERGVQVAGPYDDATYTRDVATLLKATGAKAGDRIEHPDGTFVLDGLILDNGVSLRYTVQGV